jgi:N-acetylneuraminic acid mutarotase
MSTRSLLPTLLALGLALEACSNDTTQPNPAPASASPELTVGSGTWLTRAKMPGIERWAFALATTKNAAGQSILYAIGGEIPWGPTLGTVRAYNVATNTWSRKPDMPAALASSMAGVINGKIYVAGGTPTNRNKGPSSSLFVYNPATNAWTQKRNMPEGGAGRVTGVIGGRLYVFTTSDFFTPTTSNKFFRYSPATDSWVRLPSPKNTYSTGIGAVLDGKLYVVDAEVEVYDPFTNRWTNKGASPGALYGTGVALGGKLWVVGGTLDIGGNAYPKFLIYDPANNSWTSRPMSYRMYNFEASKVFLNGAPRIEVIGGWPSTLSRNLQYTP